MTHIRTTTPLGQVAATPDSWAGEVAITVCDPTAATTVDIAMTPERALILAGELTDAVATIQDRQHRQQRLAAERYVTDYPLTVDRIGGAA